MLLVFGLGLSSPVIVVFTVLLGLVIQTQWQRTAVKKGEIKRLMVLDEEENSRAEIEASFSYSCGSTVSAEPQAQCAVCLFPTTRKCSRCKVIYYCSGRCQIIHWRKGHKDECHPPAVNIYLDGKTGKYAQNVNYTTIFDNGDSVPTTKFHPGPIQTQVECFAELSHVKHNYSFSAKCSSTSYGACFSGSSGNNKTSDDCSSGGISSNDSGKLDRCVSNDTEKEMVKIGLIVKDEYQAEMLTPQFARLDDSLNSYSGSVGSEKQSALFSDKRVQRKGSLDNGQIHDDSIVEPSVTSSGFWERALGSEDLTNGLHTSLPPINKGIQDNKLLDSTLRFSFNSSRSNSVGEVLHDRVPTKQCNSGSTLVEKLDNDAVLSSLSLNSRKLADGILDHSYDTAVKKSLDAQSSACVDSTSSSTQIQVSNLERPVETKVTLRKSVETKSAATLPTQSGVDSGRSVTDQLKRSPTSRPYSLRGTDSVGRYDMGHFSYETFVKLYTWKEVELRPSGLINCGNSCYANAVLQCLAFTPPLTAFFLQGLHSKSCTKKDWCFMCEFEGLLLKAKRGESPVSPFGIVSQLQMIGSQLSKGREEDAHEFLRYTVDAMESICLAGHSIDSDSSETDTNLMGLTFGGYLQSRIKCSKCLGKSERHERMMDLTIEIEGSVESLEAALERFTVYETLDGENKYKCNRCGSYEKAKKKLTVLESPNVLTVALKRFQTGEYGKLNKSIRFPEILNLAPYMSGTSDKSPIYRLYGVIVHLDIMNAAFSGHYICYIKNPQNKWFKIDDSQVTPVDKESVLAAKAYTLMYSRCSPRAPRSIRNKIMSTESKHRSTTLRLLPSIQSFYSKYHQFKRAFEEDSSSSDNSSLFSSHSDEGSSTGTDMTRDSTCSDDLSEFFYGYSPNRNPNGSEASSSSLQSKDAGEGKVTFLHPDITRLSSRQIASSSSGSFSIRDSDVNHSLGVKPSITFRKEKGL